MQTRSAALDARQVLEDVRPAFLVTARADLAGRLVVGQHAQRLEAAERGTTVRAIEPVWQAKARLVRQTLEEGAAR